MFIGARNPGPPMKYLAMLSSTRLTVRSDALNCAKNTFAVPGIWETKERGTLENFVIGSNERVASSPRRRRRALGRQRLAPSKIPKYFPLISYQERPPSRNDSHRSMGCASSAVLYIDRFQRYPHGGPHDGGRSGGNDEGDHRGLVIRAPWPPRVTARP